MANTVIELRHSYVTGNVPASLANGEIAINTYDGKLFYRGGASNTIQTIERYTGPAGLDTEVQFNDSGELGSDSGLTYNKSTDVLTVTGGVIAGSINLAPTIASAYNHANAAFDAANNASGAEVTISTFNTTANGLVDTFDIGFNPISVEAVLVTIDGITQPETSYTVNTSANSITFDTTPGNGEAIRVLTFYTAATPYVINDGSISPNKFSPSTNTYLASLAESSSLALAIALG